MTTTLAQPSHEIETSRFGTLQVPADAMIRFPVGLPGFPNLTEFALVSRDDGPLAWLQSCQDPCVAFVIADPALFRPDFAIAATAHDLALIGAADVADLELRVILTVPTDPRRMTANLCGPLVMNRRSQLGMQLILPGDTWGTRERVFAD